MLVIGICILYAGEKRALLIGISEYPVHKSVQTLSWKSIHGANDVNLIGNSLKKQGFKIKYLTNKAATAGNIRDALTKLINESKKGDLVYIHFSGHGQAYEDLDGDEEDGWDEAIVPYDAFIKYYKGVYEGHNHILDDDLNSYFSKLRNKVGKDGFVYVILDACHMGGASRGDEIEEDEIFERGTEDGFTPNGKKYIPKIDRRGNMKISHIANASNICIIEACRAYQTNTEIKQDGVYYGPLSFYISQCLKTTNLSSNTNWIESLRSMMNKDRRLIKQNIVIEKSN